MLLKFAVVEISIVANLWDRIINGYYHTMLQNEVLIFSCNQSKIILNKERF